MLCDEELNFCELNKETCQNGGKCQSQLIEDGNFKCECPSGYKGENCEIAPAVLITTTTTIKPGFNETIIVENENDEVTETEEKPNESDELDNEA